MSDYTPTGVPVADSAGASSEIRAEFVLIQTAIATKLDNSLTLAQLNTAVSDANVAAAGSNGDITALSAIADGTAGAPSIAHAGDPDTGIWFPGANSLAASVGGVERIRLPTTAGAMYLEAPDASNTLALDFVAAAVTRGFVSMNSSTAELRHSSGYGGYGGIQTFWTNGAERLRIDGNGNVTVSMAALLGYGTGAGGAVVQATNKATNVTLNAPSGKITMNNAALAAGAEAQFALVNSLITETCTVTINHAGAGGRAYAYRVEVRTIVAGVAYISVTNMTAGSLSEAVTLQFNVHKGATS